MVKKKSQKRKILSLFLIFNLAFFNLSAFFIFQPAPAQAEDLQADDSIPVSNSSGEKEDKNDENPPQETSDDDGDSSDVKSVAETTVQTETLISEEKQDCDGGTCPSVSVGNNEESKVANNSNTTAVYGENLGGKNDCISQDTAESSQEENTSDNNACPPDDTILEGTTENQGETDNSAALPENREGAMASEGSNDREIAEETNDQGMTVVNTGDSVSGNNIYNEINANVLATNGNGEMEVLNIGGEYDGNVDLSSQFQEMQENSENKEENAKKISVTSESSAEVENNSDVQAVSGENSVQGEEGAEIFTGNSLAVSNIINLVNTNLIGANWIYSVINIFGEWSGDLIVPGDDLIKIADLYYSNLKVNNESSAEVENNADVQAVSGENSVQGGSGDAQIESGEALAESNISNMINTNIVNNNWLSIIINNLGSWTGQVIDPSGRFQRQSGVYGYDFEIDTDKESQSLGSLEVENKSQAEVVNNADVEAVSGKNEIKSDVQAGETEAKIETGNTWAISNIVNIINTNIVGNNWIMGVVNVLGSWTGNLVFAYPDLEVGLTDNQDIVEPGQESIYEVSYRNSGNAKGVNINLKVDLPDDFSIGQYSPGGRKEGHSLVWNVDSLSPGDSGTFWIKGKIKSDISNETTAIMAKGAITAETSEPNESNNVAEDETQIFFNDAGRGYWDGEKDWDSKIKISRSSNAPGLAHPGDSIINYITVKNNGDTDLHNMVVKDEVKDENNETLVAYSWFLGDIKKGKKLTIEYYVTLGNPGKKVVFSSSARAFAYDSDDRQVKSRKVTGILSILGTMAYAQEIDQGQQISPSAGAVEGASIISNDSLKGAMPLWIWILAILAYFLSINWALFPRFSHFLSGEKKYNEK